MHSNFISTSLQPRSLYPELSFPKEVQITPVSGYEATLCSTQLGKAVPCILDGIEQGCNVEEGPLAGPAVSRPQLGCCLVTMVSVNEYQ